MRARDFITEKYTGGALGLPFPGTYEQEYNMFKRKGPRRITAMTNEDTFDLFEATSDDLYRKLDSLNAMLNDTATTPGEKENAKTLIKKIEDRLAKEFPNAEKPTAKSSQEPEWSFSDDWLSGLARAAAARDDLEKLKKSDPAAYKEKMKQKLAQMQKRLKMMRRSHIPGNMDTARQIRDYESEVNHFIRSEFPEMWKELEAKREVARRKGYEKTDKLRAKREKELKANVSKEGKGNFKTVGKEYEDALKKLYAAMKGVKFKIFGRPAVIGKNTDGWAGGRFFLHRMASYPTGAIREKWNTLDPATQKELIKAVDSVNSFGAKAHGYTPAQKKAILSAMAPYKAPR